MDLGQSLYTRSAEPTQLWKACDESHQGSFCIFAVEEPDVPPYSLDRCRNRVMRERSKLQYDMAARCHKTNTEGISAFLLPDVGSRRPSCSRAAWSPFRLPGHT